MLRTDVGVLLSKGINVSGTSPYHVTWTLSPEELLVLNDSLAGGGLTNIAVRPSVGTRYAANSVSEINVNYTESELEPVRPSEIFNPVAFIDLSKPTDSAIGEIDHNQSYNQGTFTGEGHFYESGQRTRAAMTREFKQVTAVADRFTYVIWYRIKPEDFSGSSRLIVLVDESLYGAGGTDIGHSNLTIPDRIYVDNYASTDRYPNLADGEWHMIAVVNNSYSNKSFSVDGGALVSYSTTSRPYNGRTFNRIDAIMDRGTSGEINYAAFYDRALTNVEISTLHRLGPAQNPEQDIDHPATPATADATMVDPSHFGPADFMVDVAAMDTAISMADATVTADAHFAATPAGGGAEMHAPAFIVHYAVDVATMHAVINVLDAAVTIEQEFSTTPAGVEGEFLPPTLNPDLGYVVTASSPEVRIHHVSSTSNPSDRVNTQRNTDISTYQGGFISSYTCAHIDVPPMDSLLVKPQDTIQSLTFRLVINSGRGGHLRVLGRGQDIEDSLVLSSGEFGAGSYDIDIPHNVSTVVLEMTLTYSATNSRNFANPSVNEVSYFTVVAQADSGVYPDAEPALASMEMLGASVDTTVGVSIAVAPFTMSGTVGAVTFPDWIEHVGAATGTGEMEDAWFRSAYRHIATRALVEGEFLSPVATSDRNVIVGAAAMHASANIFNPDEVSDDINDRFFEEIAKDRPSSWRRFNERIHEPQGAYLHSPNGRHRLGEFNGDYTRGLVGPGGRRSVYVNDAHIPVSGGWPTRTNAHTAYPSALEFVLKTDADHGMLASYVSHWTSSGGSGGPPGLHGGNSSTFIKDGYLFQQRGRENDHIRLSASRINDGQWHHIVLTTTPNLSPFQTIGRYNRRGIEVWIDGRLDRTVYRGENSTEHVHPMGADHLFAPGEAFQDDYTAIPFTGEIMEFAGYTKGLHKDRILAHWRALADIIPVEAGLPATAVGSMGDHKADTNMARMLILTWSTPAGVRQRIPMESTGGTDFHPIPTGIDSGGPGRGFDDVANLDDIHITYQNVQYVHDRNSIMQGWSAIGWDREEKGHGGQILPFINDNTGQRRLINLQEDFADLDDFDIIHIQNYPNPANRTQEERVLHEEFLNSVKQAIVDGAKFWISNPALAADLNLIGRYEMVPTVRRRMNRVSGRMVYVSPLDTRSWQTFPHAGHGQVPVKEGVYPWPEHIKTREQASEFLADVLPVVNDTWENEGPSRVHKIDSYANNRFRVVNEVAGLTDYPSWYIVETAAMQRYRDIHNHPFQRKIEAARYENRTGVDHPWNYGASQGTGLRVGDEFVDWGIQRRANETQTLVSITTNNRGYQTYAVPPGGVIAGRAVTTFGATDWNDAGQEVPNEYRNYATTIAVQPGDRIEGRQVGGYVFMQFSEHANEEVYVRPLAVERIPHIEEDSVDELLESGGMMPWGKESAYTLSWHVIGHRSVRSGGGGTIDVGGLRSDTQFKVDANGKVTHEVTKYYERTDTLPIANRYSSVFGSTVVPYASWTFKGIQWLKLAAPQTVGAVNTYGEAATANGSMRDPVVYAEADRIIRVEPARGSGQIIPAAGVAYRDAPVDVYAATGTATMQDPGRSVSVEPMTAIGEMSMASLRIELGTIEWLTVNMSRSMINLRVEEVAGTPPASSAIVQGEVISGGENTGGND